MSENEIGTIKFPSSSGDSNKNGILTDQIS